MQKWVICFQAINNQWKSLKRIIFFLAYNHKKAICSQEQDFKHKTLIKIQILNCRLLTIQNPHLQYLAKTKKKQHFHSTLKIQQRPK